MTSHGHNRGGKRTVEYSAWRNMLNRCFYKKGEKYRTYGQRGITVCKRWMKFENFLSDMGRCPKGLTLDRINNDGNYEPSNCRWATKSQQALNRRITDERRRSMSLHRSAWRKKKSGLPKGVVLVKGKYVARTIVLGSGIGGFRSKAVHLGTFNTIEQAASAVRRVECPKRK